MRFKSAFALLPLIFSCGVRETSEEEIFASRQVNPEPNIPLECYTDTGVRKFGKALANPCYVCHTSANTPFATERDDPHFQLQYDFPEEIKRTGNPYLNAIKPWLTIGNVPVPSDEEIESWIKQDNWTHAYTNRGSGDYLYFPDLPPIYRLNGDGTYSLVNVDSLGFVLDEEGNHTGWRVFKWKPFPGFFPTNGRIDSTFIRLPLKFRTSNGSFDLEVYRRNLTLVECAIKGFRPGEICRGTEFGDVVVPERYYGDASDEAVIPLQYPVGTEFAHPLYYLDPENTISFKALRLKEMRYMRKLSNPDLRRTSGEEEEEGPEPPWDKGRMITEYWEFVGFIEDSSGDLRPQTAEEMKFCIGCHGAIGGTVDATFTLWRKLEWQEQDYRDIEDTPYANIGCENLDELNLGGALKNALRAYCSAKGSPPGEYLIYFALTRGGDHFRSNTEILSVISSDGNVDLQLLYDPSKVNFLDERGYIKYELFTPLRERAMSINKQYFRVVKAQAFVYGRDVFGGAFGVSSGGNSLEELWDLDTTGGLEEEIYAIFRTLLK